MDPYLNYLFYYISDFSIKNFLIILYLQLLQELLEIDLYKKDIKAKLFIKSPHVITISPTINITIDNSFINIIPISTFLLTFPNSNHNPHINLRCNLGINSSLINSILTHSNNKIVTEGITFDHYSEDITLEFNYIDISINLINLEISYITSSYITFPTDHKYNSVTIRPSNIYLF